MELLSVNDESATVRMNLDEVRIISNALNEICNGIDIKEFSTRVGAELSEVEELLRQFLEIK